MRIENYGVALHSLQQEDIELVRTWRNENRVRLNMVYQKVISPEEQLVWYNSLNSTNDFYFILKHNDVPVGLINLKKINWTKRKADSGIFIGNKSYFNSTIPVIAAILLSEFAFYVINLKVLCSTTLAKNKKAVALDKQLGFTAVNDIKQEVINTQCTIEGFEKSTMRLRQSLHNKFGNEMTISCIPDAMLPLISKRHSKSLKLQEQNPSSPQITIKVKAIRT